MFRTMGNEMLEYRMRCFGMAQAKTWIGLGNLCYNLKRLNFLELSAAAV